MITQHTHSDTRRLGRLRRTEPMRALFRETRLSTADFIQPIFVAEDPSVALPIAAIPGVRRWSLRELAAHARSISNTGVQGVIVFGVPACKDPLGAAAAAHDGVIPRAVEIIREHAPTLAVITDVCLCQYTDHGHCGVLGDGGVITDATLEILSDVAVAHAAAGAHIVAPSGMIDGTVAALRRGLDQSGYAETAILSYAVKYASAFYGPFREAAHSSPAHGDRRSHQMDPGNAREALAEARQDVAEGADAIMVKPAGPSLDVIAQLRATLPEVPLTAYQVSGEYSAIAAAAANGWIDERAALLESLTAIKRAGASAIITYAATRVARWITEQSEVRP